MGLVKKILRQFKPTSIDMLVFQYHTGGITSATPEVNGIKLQQNGNEFTIQENDVLVHRSRIFMKSNLLANFGFKGRLLTIGDCMTDDRYRGKGVYPSVLNYLGGRYAKERQVYVLVAPDNLASVRGIQKAGFTFKARLKAKRFLIFYLNKNLSTVQS